MPPLAKPTYIGIDPGAAGAIVALRPDSSVAKVTCWKMPKTNLDLLGLMVDLTKNGECYAALERVSGWIGGNPGTSASGEPYKHGGQPGSSMFEFGRNYGALEMALTFSFITDWFSPTPSQWQRSLGVPTKPKGAKKEEHKRQLKEFAQSMFPEIAVTLWNADALLLAEYCRREVEKIEKSRPSLFI